MNETLVRQVRRGWIQVQGELFYRKTLERHDGERVRVQVAPDGRTCKVLATDGRVICLAVRDGYDVGADGWSNPARRAATLLRLRGGQR